MSGGSFNYLCHVHDAESLINKHEDLNAMVEALKAKGLIHAVGASQRLKEKVDKIIQLRDELSQELGDNDSLFQVWKAVEWADSMDWSEQSIEEAYENFLNSLIDKC